jgi:spore coat polysaccharide biosynthesis protein SpsF
VRRVAIVQARMTSTRLPGKVLEDLGGRTVLERGLEALGRCAALDDVVVATTANAADDPLVALAERAGARWFRGSEEDVLARYAGAAREAGADAVVRVTSDCPLIDPAGVDAVCAALTGDVDYAANILERHLPRGMDAEALHRDVLDRLDRMATSRPAREHVTWMVHTEAPALFRTRSVRDAAIDAADLRLTVDTPEDLAAVRAVWAGTGPAPVAELVAWLRAHPEVVALNAGVRQKTT